MSKDLGKSALILFQKNLELGKVKTRIAKTVGDSEALKIYQYLIRFTHKVVEALPVDRFIFYSDHLEDMPDGAFKPMVQKGNNLGQRMSNAFDEIVGLGYSSIILIGTDCGELTLEILEDAYSKLNESEVVLGPANDGGYYLIGMSKFHPELFEDISWSTAHVANQTIQKIKELGISYSTAAMLSDVDTFEDWQNQLNRVKSVISS